MNYKCCFSQKLVLKSLVNFFHYLKNANFLFISFFYQRSNLSINRFVHDNMLKNNQLNTEKVNCLKSYKLTAIANDCIIFCFINFFISYLLYNLFESLIVSATKIRAVKRNL